MHFARLRRHTLALLVLGLLAWLGQAASFQRIAQAELPSAALLTALARGDLCTAHGGAALPAGQGQAHDCCFACAGAGGGGAPAPALAAVSPASTRATFFTGASAPFTQPRYLRHPAREPPLA